MRNEKLNRWPGKCKAFILLVRKMPARILDRSFFARCPKIVARELLNKLLVSTIGGKRVSGLIVETEAYLSTGDSACHGCKGKTRKNASMFGPAGFAYVYPIHARYCFNVVTETEGRGSAVLIRAIEPVERISVMQMRRKTAPLKALCSGPAKLCQSLNIDHSSDGIDLTCRRRLWIEESDPAGNRAPDVRTTNRIGVTSAQEKRLRYVISSHEFASGPRYLR